jgi:hypothetical protein
MPIYELAHAYQVIKSTLKSLLVNMRLILEAIGMQLKCNAIVDGTMFNFCSLFVKAWFDFSNLVIQSFHNFAGAVIKNTTVADNPSVLLPMINGPLNTCRHQDICYVRVSCTVDYARLLMVPGLTMLRVAFYIELPQMTRVMVNGIGGNYNLTSWLGAADLSTLSCVEVRKNILEPCLRDGPITLSVAVNLAKANVNAKTIRDTIRAKILKLGFKQICATIFQRLCPGYSNQPHVALEHIHQSAPGPDGQMVIASVIEHYQHMMNALRPFATKQTYALSMCNWVIQGLDCRLLPCFRRLYPAHSTIHNLNGAYQCQQLPTILAAAQAAKDEVKGVQDIACGLLGQGFYTNTTSNDAAAYPSQAKKTLSRYSNGGGGSNCGRNCEQRPKKCFGCSGDHSWMKNKKVVCPWGSNPTVIRCASEMYKKYLEQLKELKARWAKGCIVDFKDMNPADQKRMSKVVLAIQSSSSQASSITASTSLSLPGPAVFVIQVPDTNAAMLSAAAPARQILPVPIQTSSPHMVLQLSQVLGCLKCPAICCVVDTATRLNTGNLHYFAAIAKACPHTVAAIYSTADHNPIILSGIVQQDGASVTTDLTVRFQFHKPYFMREGTPTTLLVACGPNVMVNTILGRPFIQATKMVLNAADQVAELRALDTPPFPLDFRHAMCTVPAVGSPPDEDSAIRHAKVINKVNGIEALYSNKTPPAPDTQKPVGILRPAKRTKSVEFNSAFVDNGSVVTVGSAIDPKIKDDTNVSDAYDVPTSA